jgi:hypothetical protein
MGLKGYWLWVMGQLDSTCRAPPRCSGTQLDPFESKFRNQDITFEFSQGLKPGGFKGYNQALY